VKATYLIELVFSLHILFILFQFAESRSISRPILGNGTTPHVYDTRRGVGEDEIRGGMPLEKAERGGGRGRGREGGRGGEQERGGGGGGGGRTSNPKTDSRCPSRVFAS